jgi:hypothetical protein
MRLHRLASQLLVCTALSAGLAAPARAQAPAPATAAAAERPFTLLGGIGWDRGSARLLTVTLTDGTSQTLRANEGFYFEAGVGLLRYRLDAVSLETATTIGVKGWEVGASNGGLSYLAFPLEVLERVAVQQVRFGLGLSLLLAPRLSSSGVLAGNDVDLKDSLGLVVQADWIGKRVPGRPGFFLGGRFVWQKLEGRHGTAAVDANAVGVRLGLEL